jgi:brefeldin A-resistance guanine nucleotide exchange factor 1
LLKGFKELRLQLSNNHETGRQCTNMFLMLMLLTDILTTDPITYLKPFLNVIRSEETSGPITGVALSSVDKFLKGFISKRWR